MKRPILALLLFGAAFGYLEAAVVSYLRVLHESARQRFHSERRPDDLFPLLTLEQVRTSGQSQTLSIEIGREAATMLMLAGIALASANDFGQWTAAFVIAFGVWDMTFYLFLKLLLGWPASLLTWDILFLIPVPWVAPVLAPVLISVAMIACGVVQLGRGDAARRARFGLWHAAGILAGGFVIILSFTLDYRNIMAGGLPRPFHWGVFALGLAIAAGSYGHARTRPKLNLLECSPGVPVPLIDTSSLPVIERLPGWQGRYFHSANMTFAHYDFARGASIHEHFHPEEEVYEVIEGELQVTIDGLPHTVRAGLVAIVPANVRHAVRALTDGKVIIVDYPARHDFG